MRGTKSGQSATSWIFTQSTYYWHQQRRKPPDRRSCRQKRDAVLIPEIHRVYEENYSDYCVRKGWRPPVLIPPPLSCMCYTNNVVRGGEFQSINLTRRDPIGSGTGSSFRNGALVGLALHISAFFQACHRPARRGLISISHKPSEHICACAKPGTLAALSGSPPIPSSPRTYTQ